MNKISCIYKITNIINGKIYIGKTTNFKRRCKEYRLKSKNPYASKNTQYEIMLEMNRYGFNNFKFEIIELCKTEDELNEKEVYWINKLNSRDPDIGYNKKTGGIGGVLTEDSKRKMSISSFSFKHTEEHKIKISKPIIVYKDNEFKIYTSAKVFGDKLGHGRSVITYCIRKGKPIDGYFIYYYNKDDRIGIPLNYSKYEKYYKILHIIETEDVETIESKLFIII